MISNGVSLFNDIDKFLTIANNEVSRVSTGMNTDIIETDENIEFKVQIPGVDKEKIDIDLEKDILTVSVENKEENIDEKSKVLLQEIKYQKSSRSFRIPFRVDDENISASYKKGILKIVIPKITKERSKKINID